MRIRRVFWPGIFLLWILPLGSIAQLPDQGQGQWLWKIDERDGQAPTYLFAVLHHAHPAFAENFSRILPQFQSSRYYASVWPYDALSRNELISLIQREDSKTLRKEYHTSSFKSLDQLIPERLGDELISYSSWQPLYLRRVLQDAGRKQIRQRFWDEELHFLAEGFGLDISPVLEPEVIARQMNAVALQDQLKSIKEYSEKPAHDEALLDQFAGPYVEGDWEELAKRARIADGEAVAVRMLDGMALVSATGILEMAYEPGGFIGIPAELLGGPKGVLSRLEELGVELKPVDVSMFIAELRASIPPWMMESVELPLSPLPEEEEVVSESLSLSQSSTSVNPLFSDLDALAAMPTPSYLADPFSDLREPSDLDTSFLRQWINYQPREKDFSVRLPFTPQNVSNIFKAEGGTVEVQIYLLNDPVSELYFLISRSQYPSPLELPDPVRFFDNAVGGTRAKFDGLTLAERVISTPLYRGREFVFSLPDARYLRGQLLLMNNNLYQLVVIGDSRNCWDDQAEFFLRSFSLPRSNVRTWAQVIGTGFRARMPIAPVSAKRTVQTAGGPIPVDIWSLEDPISKITYFISTSYYPKEVAKSSKEFLDQTIYGTVNNLKGNLISEENIKIGRQKGRVIQVETPGKKYRIIFILDESILYQIMVGAPEDKIGSGDIEYYFDSFTFQ